MTTLRARVSRLSKGPGGAFLILLGFLLLGVFVNGSVQTEKTIKAQIAGCERGKSDRVAHVKIAAAMARYYHGVTQAESVKADVKEIAATVQEQLTKGAAAFRSRIVLCDPLIRDKKQVPDEKLLKTLPQLPSAK